MRFGDEVGKTEVAAQNEEKTTTTPSARGNLIFLDLASGLSPKFYFYRPQ